MMMTGKIRPDVRRQADSRGLDVVGGIPSLHNPTNGQNDATGPGGPSWTGFSCRPAQQGMIGLSPAPQSASPRLIPSRPTP